MKKSINNVLRAMGCFVLSTAIVLSCACSAKETEESKKKKKNKKPKETTEETQETDDTGDTTEDTTAQPDPTDPTDPPTADIPDESDPNEKAKLQALDEKILMNSFPDIIDMEFTFDNPEVYGLEWPEVGLDPWTEDDSESREFIAEVLSDLDDIDFELLCLEDRVLYETIKYDYEMAKSMEDDNYYTSSINSLTGINAELPTLFATLAIEDVESAERYIVMINDVYPFLESLVEYEMKKAEAGNALPDRFLENIVDSCKAVYENHDGNYMYTSFEEKINNLDCDDATKADLIARNKEALDNSFFPAYEMLGEKMASLYGTATTNGNLCEMEGGKEFYERYFQYRSGTSLTVDEAIEILENKIDEGIAYLMMPNLSQDQMKKIQNDDIEPYTTGSFESDIAFCQEAIKDDFPTLPQHEYVTYHVPQELAENFSPAAYMTTQLDNLNRNLLMLNDYSDGLGDLLTTVAHEAYPGHLFEAVYHIGYLDNFYQKTNGTTAYKEGWSTYCEDYIMVLTDYDYDIYKYNKVNSDIINYYLFARADIGVHYEGWSFDDLVSYLSTYFGKSVASQIADFYYDLIIEIPCYVTPYCFGNMNCTQIIQDAVAVYGNDYSMKEIHAAYLDMGPSSFDILAKYMPLYVEKQH
ncbi:MAG: DUF885 domain-containing protein [Clostridiales bacterium]|nr:DUF885 domain-containing protein [Clostridiales bacterium]